MLTQAADGQVALEKWRGYWRGKELPPWDSDGPCSQLTALLAQQVEGGSSNGATKCALDLGCGSGANTVLLAQHGFAAVGVDVAQEALDRGAVRASLAGVPTAAAAAARAPGTAGAAAAAAQGSPAPAAAAAAAAAAAGGGSVTWLCDDVFELASRGFRSGVALLFDLQCFHAVRGSAGSDAERRFAAMVAALLEEGGRYIVVAGNADEAAGRGPPVLTREELVAPFEAEGLALLSLEACRFDATATYGVECPPLAWCAVFEQPRSHCSTV